MKASAFIGALAAVVVLVAGYFIVAPAFNQTLGAGAGPEDSNPYASKGGVQSFTSTASCITGTSTVFSIRNPLNATSTLAYASIRGLNGATTTDIIVGTSTTPAPAGTAVATTSIVGNIFGLYSIAANATFSSVAGVTMGPGTGYKAPSAGTYPTSQSRVVIGPGEYVIGFSTSTNPTNNGGITASTLSLPVSCLFDYVFIKL
jgi:hypothetical protein